MDNALNVALSRQMTLRREYDLLAHNIANADTAGFKVESLMLHEKVERPAPPRPARLRPSTSSTTRAWPATSARAP